MISNKIQFIPKRPGEPDISMAKIDNAKKFLSWKPSIKFREGVTELLNNIHF